MTRLEFYEILDALGIDNHILNARGANGLEQEVYFWNNLLIYFSGTDYAIIKGNIPLEFANILYNKYPESHQKMRINGGVGYIPIEQATDELCGKEVRKLLRERLDKDDYEYNERLKKIRSDMLNRPNEDKYIEEYCIDSKEELIIFLTELKDYCARKKGLPESEVQRYDEIMSTTTCSILKKVNPCITSTEWMAADKENGEKYLKTIEKEKETSFGREFRNVVDQFDKTINPFINEEIELYSADNYLKKVKVTADVFNEVHHKKRNGCCKIAIGNGSESEVSYFRNPDGFIYRLWYALGKGEYLTIAHYFRTDAERESDNGELISIDYFGDDSNQDFNLIYNITKGLAGEYSEPKKPITPEQMTTVLDTLSKGTRLASTITVDNMAKEVVKKSNSKKNL